MWQKIEIMHFEVGKLFVIIIELCAKLSANINKKKPFSFVLHTFCITKSDEQKKRPHLLKVHFLTQFYLTHYI